MKTDCILWTKSTTTAGYGQLKRGGKKLAAHRVAWEEKHGPIPDGMCICHKCDNPPCVNVDHLFLGTYSDNIKDSYAKKRHMPRNQVGARNGNARITEQTAIRIKMLAGVVEAATVARWLGLTTQAVWRTMHGYSWKHVTAKTRYGI